MNNTKVRKMAAVIREVRRVHGAHVGNCRICAALVALDEEKRC